MKKIGLKWTSINRINNYKHYEIKNMYKKQKKIELFAVCNKKISIKIENDTIKDRGKWLPGWK